MNLARLPGWPRLLRATLAARYVDMSGAQFDKAGCSAAETAAISGQSLVMVEHYARARNQDVLGGSAVLKWERK